MIHLLFVVSGLVPTSGTPAQEAIRWEGDLVAALDRARTSGRPLFLAVNMDGEKANDEMAEAQYRSPEVVARSRRFHCLVASRFEHPAAEEGGRSVCSRFGSVTCAEHQAVERETRRRFLGGRSSVTAPQHLFVRSDGTLLFRREWWVSSARLLEWMAEALRESGAAAASEGEEAPLQAFEKAKWAERLRAKSVEDLRQALRDAVALDRPEAQALLEEHYGKAGSDADRIEALRAMGQVGYDRAVPFLLKVAGGRNRTLRRHAIVSLEIVGEASAAEPLFQAAKRETEARVLKELLRAVARLAPDREEVAELVLRRCSDPDPLVRGNALVAAADLGDPARSLPAIRRALDDKSTEVRGCAVHALGLAGGAADLDRLSEREGRESDLRLRLLIGGARLRIATGGAGEPPPEHRLALAFFAEDDIPHDGTWPAPRLGERRGF